jgi:uroporphyrinogen III methyltransferase/synthase
VDLLPLYETCPDDTAAPALRTRLAAGEVDAVAFTASSTVRHFHALLPEQDLGGVRVACIGPITAATARECGFEVDVVAAEHTVRGLVRALEEAFAVHPD